MRKRWNWRIFQRCFRFGRTPPAGRRLSTSDPAGRLHNAARRFGRSLSGMVCTLRRLIWNLTATDSEPFQKHDTCKAAPRLPHAAESCSEGFLLSSFMSRLSHLFVCKWSFARWRLRSQRLLRFHAVSCSELHHSGSERPDVCSGRYVEGTRSPRWHLGKSRCSGFTV